MAQETGGTDDGFPNAASLKEEGNTKFKAGSFAEAIDAYSRSLSLDSQQHLCFSNRSAAYVKMALSSHTATDEKADLLSNALADAESCIELRSDWAKGYSRQQAALQELKRWDDALKACEQGIQKASDEKEKDTLRKTLLEVRARHFHDRLRGTWHGTVSETLGGYDQEMEFLDESQVRVEVLGRSIVGRLQVACPPDGSADTMHMNIQVPMQDVPPGMPPPPPVPYITKIDSAGLHICCPYMKMERPTDFEGAGYCLMKPGSASNGDTSEVSKLSKDEKLVACTKELIEALPNSKLEEPSQTDSEDDQREKLMAQVRFESSMYAVQKKYSEEIMKEVLEATRIGAGAPAVLATSQDFSTLKEKLSVCGILDQTPAAAPPPSAAATPPVPKAPASETTREVRAPTSGATHKQPATSDQTTTALLAITVGLAVAAGVAVFLRRRQDKK